MVSPPQRRYSWAEMLALTDELARLLSGARYDAIVCVLRGGAFAGLMLSHLLDVRDLYAVRASVHLDDAVRGARHDVVGVEPADGFGGLAGQRVLIVDDVANTGRTLAAATAAIRAGGCEDTTTAALLWDTVGTSGVDAPCDVYAEQVAAWVVFPWEKSPQIPGRESRSDRSTRHHGHTPTKEMR